MQEKERRTLARDVEAEPSRPLPVELAALAGQGRRQGQVVGNREAAEADAAGRGQGPETHGPARDAVLPVRHVRPPPSHT